jgi:uncharacterized protein YicC (UPF0701 family)
MKVSIPHKYSQIEAITRVRKILNESRSKLADHLTDVEEKWDANTLHFAFTAQKQHISGTLEVKDKVFELYAKLPLTLRLFEGRIEKMIKEQAGAMLGK